MEVAHVLVCLGTWVAALSDRTPRWAVYSLAAVAVIAAPFVWLPV